MPNWNAILKELGNYDKGPHDLLRAKYLNKIQEHTQRNVLVYYSGWLQKPQKLEPDLFTINDSDKTGFMTCSSGLDRSKGLDLLLHTPGGDVAATESIVSYLQSLYDGNIRAIIPQLAMSGGTLIALSCKEIIMGRQSSIGPVDPQVAGMPAQGLLEEFELATQEINANPAKIELWRPIISKYWPTLITTCKHAIDWSDELLREFLTKGMFAEEEQTTIKEKIDKVAKLLGRQSSSKSHNRHISKERARSIGLKITALEDDQTLQDLVLSLHHALTLTFTYTSAVKIIENHTDGAFIQSVTVN